MSSHNNKEKKAKGARSVQAPPNKTIFGFSNINLSHLDYFYNCVKIVFYQICFLTSENRVKSVEDACL